jgi:hypothetical protein
MTTMTGDYFPLIWRDGGGVAVAGVRDYCLRGMQPWDLYGLSWYVPWPMDIHCDFREREMTHIIRIGRQAARLA